MGLESEFGQLLHSALDSQSSIRCSRWVCKYRIVGEPYYGNYSFNNHIWVKEPHDCNSETIVIMKGAQLGWTEFAINKMLFTLDQLKRNVAYILPNERPTAANFSRGRINTVCELSPYFSLLFNKSNNEGHKVTKYGNNLYIRGANSRTGLKEYSASLVILDELDEMSFEAVGLAYERMSGQPEGKRQLIMLSTPSIEGKGIHFQFKDSTQSEFFFKCPHCSKFITFKYPESLVVTADSLTDPKIEDSYYICYECKHKLSQSKEYLREGLWVDKYKDRPIKGYHVSQLFSCAIGPNIIAKSEVRGRDNLAFKTEFYNSKLGMPFVAEGSNISQADINRCKREYMNNDYDQRKQLLVTMGVDIGQENHHVSVVGWWLDGSVGTRDIVTAGVGKLLYFGTVKEFDEIENLMQLWKPRKIVIDAQPEVKSAISLCKKYKGIAHICYYSLGKNVKNILIANVNEHSISVSRTYWLDATLSKIKTEKMAFPLDISMEYQNHLTALTKVYSMDDTGNTRSEYVKKESAGDHYFHSLNYATIALGMLAGTGNILD